MGAGQGYEKGDSGEAAYPQVLLTPNPNPTPNPTPWFRWSRRLSAGGAEGDHGGV